MFMMFGGKFSKHLFIFIVISGELNVIFFSFILDHAQMAIDLSRSNRIEGSLDSDVNTVFVRMMKS